MIGLVSCDKCATVFDVSKLNFPEDIYTEEHDVDLQLGAWDQEEQSWRPYVKCFHCSEPIFKR
jgi:hypothetical protein